MGPETIAPEGTGGDHGLVGNAKSPAEALVQLVHEWRLSQAPGPQQNLSIAAERLRAVQMAGAVASMFGGLKGQQYLFKRVEETDPTAAKTLSKLWDYVGEWLS